MWIYSKRAQLTSRKLPFKPHFFIRILRANARVFLKDIRKTEKIFDFCEFFKLRYNPIWQSKDWLYFQHNMKNLSCPGRRKGTINKLRDLYNDEYYPTSVLTSSKNRRASILDHQTGHRHTDQLQTILAPRLS